MADAGASWGSWREAEADPADREHRRQGGAPGAADEGGAAPAEEPIDAFDLAELEAFLAAADADAGVDAAGAAPPPPLEEEEARLPAPPPGFEGASVVVAATDPSPAHGGGSVASALVAATKGRAAGGGGLVEEAQASVSVEHEDPAAAYLAVTSWDELNLPKELLDGIFEMGFVKPSKIQEWTIPIAMRGGNIIGQAQNGSGKTAAFSLSMLLATDLGRGCPQALCLCPTRELASQNHEVVKTLGKFMGVSMCLAVPQVDRFPRKIDSQIIVGTPGKLQDLIKKRVIDTREVRIFVVDEADVMIDEDQQMGPQVTLIRSLLPSELQVLLFSATWPERVEKFAKSMVPRPNRITVTKEDLTLASITQTFIDVGRDDRKKVAQLSDLYGALNIGQSIVFVNTRNMAFDLAKLMKAEGHAVSLICGTQKTGAERIDVGYRDKVMGQFRSGVTKVLISTDVLARGIDVPAVTLVVNYEMPMQFGARDTPDYETYMHRIGRTGRFGLKGIAVNLIATHERPLVDKIKSHYRCSIAQLSGDCEEMEGLLKDLR